MSVVKVNFSFYQQETATFPDPSDKRAVRFLLESQQELGAFVTHIRGFLDSSGRVVRLQEGDGARVRELIRFCAQYGHTRSRRLSSEYQGYKAGGSKSKRGTEQRLARWVARIWSYFMDGEPTTCLSCRNEKLKSKHEGIKTNKPRAAQSGWLTKKYFR